MATTNENLDGTSCSSNSIIQKNNYRRNWTSGNFDVIEVFDDENQLNNWFVTLGGGGDWVIECKRETRTHHVTEFICRFSRKYSGRRLNTTPYDCHSRLRIRRPLNLDMDQSIIVEKTTADHDHEPKEITNQDFIMSETNDSIDDIQIDNNTDGGLNENGHAEQIELIYVKKEPEPSSGPKISDSINSNKEELSDITKKSTSQFASENKDSKQPQHDNYLSRPKRNRSRRVYSPSPPSRLSGEPRPKKEKSLSMESNTVISASPLLQNKLIDGKIPWAKEQPKQAHANKSQKPQGKKLTRTTETAKPTETTNLVNSHSFLHLSSPYQLTQPKSHNIQCATMNRINSNLIQQNEKWIQENAELKQINQEQQQQIQALIDANRELIWAFNESRREHNELMTQLRTIIKSTKDNPTSSMGGSANSHVGSQKTPQNYHNGLQARKGRKQMELTFSRTHEKLPDSTATLNHKQRHDITPSDFVLNDSTSPERKHHKTANEQLMAMIDVKPEQIYSEHTVETSQNILPVSNLEEPLNKLTKEEEIAKIKMSLQLMPPNPVGESNKLIGSRRPAFFTPTEHGDWHSVISGDVRKQMVLQIFHALCPEIKHKSIEEYIKTYPSRENYIQKSIDFSFDAENELFVSAESRDAYFIAIAKKIFTLCEAVSRFSMTTSSPSKAAQTTRKVRKIAGTTTSKSCSLTNNSVGKRNVPSTQQKKRTLADLLKPTRFKQIEASQIEEEPNNGDIDDDYDDDGAIAE